MEFRPSGTVGVAIVAPKEEKFSTAGRPVFMPGKDPVVLDPVDPRGGPVKAWSVSILFKFENCPHHVFLEKVKRVPQESGEAADRGSRIHDIGEKFVKGEELPEGAELDADDFPVAYKKFKNSILALREEFANGNVDVEGEWAFDIDWAPTGWTAKETWSRHKLDALWRDGPTSAIVIDYKTGKKFGNELKHNQQGYDYAIAAFMRDPTLEFIRTEFWYLDTGETMINSYTRVQAMALLPGLERRGVKLTSCLDFAPRPSKSNCRFCPYKGNACEWSE